MAGEDDITLEKGDMPEAGAGREGILIHHRPSLCIRSVAALRDTSVVRRGRDGSKTGMHASDSIPRSNSTTQPMGRMSNPDRTAS